MTVLPAGWPHARMPLQLDEVDSTNSEAMRRVLAGERGPLWILARRQTAGRGRSGRSWEAAPGNLFASCVVTLDAPPAQAGQLSLVAGVAVIEALVRAGSIAGLRLKWPNDVLAGHAKLGGILVESTTRPGEPGTIAIIGVGLNLAAAPENLSQSATFLAAHGLALSPDEALCFLAQTMSEWIAIWDNGAGFAQVREAWLQRAGAIGEALSVNAAQGAVHGRFAGLDDSGALLVDDAEGRRKAFSFGDVTLTARDGGA